MRHSKDMLNVTKSLSNGAHVLFYFKEPIKKKNKKQSPVNFVLKRANLLKIFLF